MNESAGSSASSLNLELPLILNHKNALHTDSSYHELPDTDLISRINKGEDRAFEALYDRHRDWAFRMAYRLTGHQHLADDVLQELFCYFLSKFPGFVLTANLRTFFYPVVRNLSLNAVKKARQFEGGPAAIAYLHDLPDTQALAHGQDDMHDITAGLSAEHREVLLLRFVDGMTVPEIAELTAIPLGTVKSRLHHALALLRKNPVIREMGKNIERTAPPHSLTL